MAAEMIHKLETDPYAQYGANRGWSGAGHPTGADAALFARLLGNDAGPGKRILDVGFGDGRFLTWVRTQGGTAAGLERQSSLLAGARSAGFEARESVEEFEPASFDAITAFDVMEHIPIDVLPDLVRSLVGRLKPGGKLIVRVPNCQVPAGLAIQYSDHTHCTPLSGPTIEWLLLQSGLQCVEVIAAPETIAADAALLQRLRFALLPLRHLMRRMALRMIGIPTDVLSAHNVIAMGVKVVTMPTVDVG